jgi:uncharacterized protein YceK
MRRIALTLLALALSLSLSGCLGTIVTAPGATGRHYKSTDAHIVLLPTAVNAGDCAKGMKEVTVSVPLWGVAVGIITFGIVVPMTTTFTCAG